MGAVWALAIAERFLASGASVALWDIDPDTLAQAAQRLDAGTHVVSGVVDVSDYAAVEAATERVAQAFGGIDILVNSAGIAGVNEPVETYPLETWARVQRVNLDGTFHTCRAIVPVMRRGGYGRIANIASMAGKDGNPNASAYSVSKAAVIALTKSLGKELADTDIRVNAVAPAVICRAVGRRTEVSLVE